ncbi:MAG: pyrroline-5-carboxylate reductase [Armatimonadota bacterium]
MTIAVLGAGKMGGALVRGWVAAGVVEPRHLRVHDPSESALAKVVEFTGAIGCGSASDAVRGADVVLLAVKPWLVTTVCAGIAAELGPKCLVLSIAAGIRTATIEEALSPGQPVVRAMPNTPALVGASATGYCRGQAATAQDAERTQALFDAVGSAVEVTEPQMDAVLGVASSGVAYLYLAIEAMADGGVRAGLPRELATTLAAQTALGAARMVLETGEHPAVLKDQVTTPAGTTIEALATLERAGARSAFVEAVMAATERSRALGKPGG